MTATIEQFVPAAPPNTVAPGKEPANKNVLTPDQRVLRKRTHEERVSRWKAITDAGGIDKWVQAELAAKGLSTQGLDPAKLKESEKAGYKEKKKAEAQARRELKRAAWEAYRATHIVHLGQGVHWDDKVDHDKLDLPDRPERLRQLGLPDLETVDKLAEALSMNVSRLRWFTFHREVDTGSHYRSWQIPKRDGSMRTITAPKKELKAAQRWALRHVYERLPVHGAAHGFLPARSIVSNAEAHADADVVVKLDIQDFFPTITWKRVKGLLRKGGLPEQAATLLALLSTESPRELIEFRGKTLHVAKGPRALPQGAPTSPAITNAICLRMDRRLSGLARKLNFRYTRYADDLAFSWRAPEKKGPHDKSPKAPVGVLISAVKKIIQSEGFRVHPRKTQVLRAGMRQRITGLVVNGAKDGQPKARVPRTTLRQLRAALHNREHGKPGKAGESLAQLRGMAAFVHMTDPVKGKALLARIAALEAKEPAAAASATAPTAPTK
jgi:hypothetical protein